MSDISIAGNPLDLKVTYGRRHMPEKQTTKMMKSDKGPGYEVVKEGGDISTAAATQLSQEEADTRRAKTVAAATKADEGADPMPKQESGEGPAEFGRRMRAWRDRQREKQNTPAAKGQLSALKK